VLEAVEGPISLNRCLLRGVSCELEPYCAIHDVWVDIQARLTAELRSVTLSHLVKNQAAKRKRMGVKPGQAIPSQA
jgi:DNA-binding IscR family transcriptional regulator